MLKCYIECEDTETMTMPGRLLEDIGRYLQSLSASDLSQEFNRELYRSATETGTCFNNFKSFVQTRARTDDTWRFWVQFVFQDAVAYIAKAINSLLSSNPNDVKREENIQAQIQTIETSKLLISTDTNRGLINPFTNKEATVGQHHDLLNFRAIGQQEFLLQISSVILKQPSVNAPNRRRRLQTFSERKVTKSRITQLEKDKKLILSAMKKKFQFSRRIGEPIDKPGEQLIELPLAISDNTGSPLKGQKSYTSKSLESRYKSASPQVFITSLPWRPECTLLEGMFLINTNPLGSHKTLGDYAKFIMTRFILVQFKRGSREVHVVFDHPGRLKNTPKYFEHLRRDVSAKLVNDHCCDTFITTTKVPKRWREGLPVGSVSVV